MSEQVYVLEKAWTAETGKTWKIEFEPIPNEADQDHYYFRVTCVPNKGDPFIFMPQVSRALLTTIGIDPGSQPKLLMRVTAGRCLEDLKTRLNAGHDVNFGGGPYCKTYTVRDADRFRKFLPKPKE